MLSAMQTPSYKSQFIGFDEPRDEEQIDKEITSVKHQIREVFEKIIDLCDMDVSSVDTVTLLETLNRSILLIPEFYTLLEDLEDEYSRAYLRCPDPDQEYDNQEAYA